MHRAQAPIRELRNFYPQFSRIGPGIGLDESWIGTLAPFRSLDTHGLAIVISDLAAGRPVCLDSGSLLHDARCIGPHRTPAWLGELEGADRQVFSVRIEVAPRPMHPKAFAIYPEISSRLFPTQPHLFRGLQGQHFWPASADALCLYRPGDGEWSWNRADLVTFVDFVAIYLVKHFIWHRTLQRGQPIWVGPQASHNPADLLRELNPYGECRCGRGDRYADCCRELDVAQALANARARSALTATLMK
jgi:hypothetical protein